MIWEKLFNAAYTAVDARLLLEGSYMHSVSKHMRVSETTTKLWMKIDLYCQPYEVFADIRGGSLERGRQTTVR